MTRWLWDWWDGVLSEEQRRALEAALDLDVPNALALEILRASQPLHVLETHIDPLAPDGFRWRLTPEVATFVDWREHERRHPEGYK